MRNSFGSIQGFAPTHADHHINTFCLDNGADPVDLGPAALAAKLFETGSQSPRGKAGLDF